MILLDTNVLSELMKANPDMEVVAWVDEQPTTTLFISAIIRAEIELGIALLPEGQRKQNITYAAKQMFDAFSERQLVFGEMSAIQYGNWLLTVQETAVPLLWRMRKLRPLH